MRDKYDESIGALADKMFIRTVRACHEELNGLDCYLGISLDLPSRIIRVFCRKGHGAEIPMNYRGYPVEVYEI